MRLRLVVLDDFFMNSEKKSAKKYFNMLVGMKKRGTGVSIIVPIFLLIKMTLSVLMFYSLMRF